MVAILRNHVTVHVNGVYLEKHAKFAVELMAITDHSHFAQGNRQKNNHDYNGEVDPKPERAQEELRWEAELRHVDW